MEVHHHPDINHKKKNFKEYFLEFLMIFLAVTMGFIAENIRENISDKEHVQLLCEQLVNDLKKDTAALNKNISLETIFTRKEDSLFYLLQQPIGKADLKKMQELILDCFNVTIFRASTGAITEIKNELHLKQLSNSKIMSYITDYESDLSRLRYMENYQQQNERQYTQTFIIAHFTPANMRSSLTNTSDFNNHVIDAQVRNLTQNDMTQLSVSLEDIQTYDKIFITNYSKTKETAERLMDYVTDEFDLQKKQ
jgi:hypothetical protein